MRQKSVTIKREVTVVGAGPAGFAAAISAARNGADVQIVELEGYLGGMSTAGLVKPFMTNYFGNEKIIDGVFGEVIEKLKEKRGAHGPLKCIYGEKKFQRRDNVIRNSSQLLTHGTGGYITLFDHEILKFILQKMMEESGVQILLHSLVNETIIEGNKVKGVVAENKSGRYILLSDVIIDATGDGDVSAVSDCRFIIGKESNGLCQGATLMFTLGGVDTDRIRKYILRNPTQFDWVTFSVIEGPLPSEFENSPIQGSGFFDVIEKSKKKGTLLLGRNQLTFFTDLRRGEWIINATRVNNIDGTKVEDLTRAELEARKQAMSLTQVLQENVSGFKSSFILSTAHKIGIRESRKIVGDYTLTKKDVLSGRKFFDAICKGGFPVDIHDPEGDKGTWIELDAAYTIPYRCLLPKGMDNLLVAGRCISATHEAQASIRVMPTCMAIGQAAGTAAALSIKKKSSPRNLDIKLLQETLKQQGAIL